MKDLTKMTHTDTLLCTKTAKSTFSPKVIAPKRKSTDNNRGLRDNVHEYSFSRELEHLN